MKLAKVLHLDISDQKIYPRISKQGEWAVTGTFMFSDIDKNNWTGKEQIAFRDGWLGTETCGYATIVQVNKMSEEQKKLVIKRLASLILQKFKPPGSLAAFEAANIELDDMITLCHHPIGTLLRITRELQDEKINEKVSVINLPLDQIPIPIWGIE